MTKKAKPMMLAIDKGIATISLNRPTIRNALDNATIVLFTNYLEQVQLDKNVKAVILKGEKIFVVVLILIGCNRLFIYRKKIIKKMH